MSFSILHRLDADLSPAEDRELRPLLAASFPHEAVLLTRRYVYEMPAHRWLVRAPSGQLIAQVAAHDKTISVAGRDLRVGGIAEVCVALPFRGQGLVRTTLAHAHDWMRLERIPFSMLFGIPQVYRSSGYFVVENPILARGALISDKPMIRPIATESWPAGLVDLRGPTF